MNMQQYKDLKHENVILYNRLKKWINKGYIGKTDKKRLNTEIVTYYTHYNQYINNLSQCHSYWFIANELANMNKEFRDIAQLIQDHIIL